MNMDILFYLTWSKNINLNRVVDPGIPWIINGYSTPKWGITVWHWHRWARKNWQASRTMLKLGYWACGMGYYDDCFIFLNFDAIFVPRKWCARRATPNFCKRLIVFLHNTYLIILRKYTKLEMKAVSSSLRFSKFCNVFRYRPGWYWRKVTDGSLLNAMYIWRV